MRRRRRDNFTGQNETKEATDTQSKFNENRNRFLDKNPIPKVNPISNRKKYNGIWYESTIEADWAQILDQEYKVPFEHHVKLQCHNKEVMMTKEIDFTHPPIMLPDGTIVNATEVKGEITPDSIARNNAIRFSYPQYQPRMVSYEDIHYIFRWGFDGSKKPTHDHSRKWSEERELVFLGMVAKLFRKYGVTYQKSKPFMSYDSGGQDRPAQKVALVLDMVFEFPQKPRGIGHEVDGIIVRLEPTPQDYLLVRSMKRYHNMDIAIVTRTFFKLWNDHGLFIDGRHKQGIRFGNRKKARTKGELSEN